MDLKEPLIKANRVLKYSITYQEITEESREYGEVSDSGFIIENETDEIGNLLKLAVETYGIYYPVAFGWWESTNPVQNKDYFEKGIEIYYILHITNEDGTDITENESDFITFLLSDGNYNKDEFTEFAIGGIVAGAIALGIGGLIAYYYFNKGKKSYPTGRAWTKEHYNDNDDEDYEVSPNERNIKHKARNRQFDNGGGVENTFVNVLLDYGFVEKRSSYGVRHFYNKFKNSYASLDDKQRMLNVYIDDDIIVQGRDYDGYSIRELINYLKTNEYESGFKVTDYADGGGVEKEKSLRHFILEQVSSGMIANKIPYSDYKTIDAIRFTALQILNRDGDREYSMKSFSDLIQEALLEYEENKYENKFDNGGRVKKMYYHIIEYGDYGNIGYQGYYETKEEAQKQVDKLSDYFPNQTFQIFLDNSKKEPPITTMNNGGEIQVGNKFGDWSITQYKPIVYEEIGGTRDGLIKLVNQDTFDEILVQYDGALRNPKWFARIKGVRVEGKSPKEVIEKLKFADGGGVENAEMPTRERTTITRPTTTPTEKPKKPDRDNPYKPKHIPKPKARK